MALQKNWEQTIKSYLDYLKIERGLAANSISSYRRDLQKKLDSYLKTYHIDCSPTSIDREQLLKFVYDTAKTISPRSQARLLSGLKGFFDYLILEKRREDHPLQHIDQPKIGKKLPDTLSLSEIDALIGGVDLSHPQGFRNQTILETLYSWGSSRQ